MVPNLSAIMAVYAGDQVDPVEAAIDSIITQTRQPDEFIVVIDGPIGDDLASLLKNYAKRKLITLHPLAENQGRGPARNFAISKARGDVVALMDADDISRPDRFAIQLDFLVANNLDVLGGFIAEFDNVPGDQNVIRRVPLDGAGIRSMVRFRSPFNHVTLMYARSFFEEIGGYSDLNFVEDWDFYLRAVNRKGRVANLPKILVDVRAVQIRRRGWRYFREEIVVLRSAYSRGQLSTLTYFLSIAIRVLKLIMPSFILTILYRTVLRRSS